MYMGKTASPVKIVTRNKSICLMMFSQTNQPDGCLRQPNSVLIFEGPTLHLNCFLHLCYGNDCTCHVSQHCDCYVIVHPLHKEHFNTHLQQKPHPPRNFYHQYNLLTPGLWLVHFNYFDCFNYFDYFDYFDQYYSHPQTGVPACPLVHRASHIHIAAHTNLFVRIIIISRLLIASSDDDVFDTG